MDTGESFIGYFIDNQFTLIQQLRYQMASIEVSVTARGTQSYDLSQSLKRDNSANRMRRDSYTSLLLGAWLMKVYQEIIHSPVEQYATFTPILI